MPCVPINGGIVCCAGPLFRQRHKGRIYTFEIHRYFGPVRCDRRGEPAKNIPGERHPFWRAFGAWCRRNPGWADKHLMPLPGDRPAPLALR